MRVLIGLGNPGPTYHNTRHNLGFWVIDILAERWRIPLVASPLLSRLGQGSRHARGNVRTDGDSDKGKRENRWTLKDITFPLEGHHVSPCDQTVLLVQPQTFMNNSGEAAGRIRHWYGLSAADFLVVHDDLALPAGRIRVKRGGGGAGGNRGVASIIDGLGSPDFPRVKIGIGRPQDTTSVTEFVLRRFTPQEGASMLCAARHAADAVEAVCTRGLEWAMDGFNRIGCGG
ncbi:MAG: aminoacyl-tRNA hydrolase [Desulfurellaceae bacterium]|nr:aminoacyl-tRNA hydrolase [Desulfurellaceae bacterium]